MFLGVCSKDWIADLTVLCRLWLVKSHLLLLANVLPHAVPKSSSKPELILLKHLLKPLVHVFSAVACSVAAFAGVVDLQPIEAFNAMQPLAHFMITMSESIIDLL